MTPETSGTLGTLWAMGSPGLVGGVLFVWTNAFAVALAARMSRRLLPDADLPTRVLGGLVAFVATTEVVLLLAGATGAVRPLPQAALVTLLFAVERFWPRARVDGPRELRLPAWGVPTWVAVGVLAVLLLNPVEQRPRLTPGLTIPVGWVPEIVARGVGFAWDDLSYHATTIAWWAQTGTLSIHPYTYQAYYPLNAELHGLWYVVPFGCDAQGNLATLSWLGLAIAGFAVLTRQLGHSRLLAAAMLAAFLASPKVRTAQFQFTPNDLALASLVVAMFALCWVPSAPSGSGERRSARGRAFLCGVAAGLAIGTKPLVAPLVAMAGVAWMWRTRRAPRAREGALAHAAVFALGAVLFGSFWYARNWIVAGNPVFPAMVGPFEGPFTPGAQASTSLMRFIDESGHLPEFWDDLFRGRLNWPYEVGVTAMAGYALALWGLAWDRDRTRRGQRLLLLVAGLTYLAMFPYQPFSGTVNRPDAPIAHVVRYLMIPFVLGLVLVPSLLAFLRPRGPAPPLAAVPAVPRPVLRWAGLAGLLLLALSTPFKARATSERLFEERHGAPVGPMWRAIEDLPDGSRVTMLSNDPTTHAMFYPLFGRRWQHTPVAIYGNGMPRRALHEVWRDEPLRWWWEFDVQRRTPARLLHNLRLSGVDYVLVTRWPRREDDAAWPVSREILLGSLEESARVFAGGYAEIWDVNGERKDQAE